MGEFDIYQHVTDSIIERLEAGTVPWRKPWREDIAGGGWARNISGRPYRGINQILLSMMGYESPYWLTFNQAQKAGGSVRKGEKSTMVVFWKFLRVKDETKQDGARTVPMLRYYRVFNIAQCDGIDAPELELRGVEFDAIAEAEEILGGIANGPEIVHGGSGAWYNPRRDEITMPVREAFRGEADGYYGTLFHELVHATGAESRLNRPEVLKPQFGSEPYAREELVAEMGSAMLCALAGLDSHLDQSAAYIGGWLKALKDDKRLVITAASRAHNAVDWIAGRVVEIEEESTAAAAGQLALVA